MDMLRSAKGTSQDDDFDDEEDFVMKKESSSTSQIHRGLFSLRYIINVTFSNLLQA